MNNGNQHNKSPEISQSIINSLIEYAIFTLDKEGNISTWSRGAERILHYKQEEILGQSGDILYTPEDRVLLIPSIELGTALREGRAIDERYHLRKGGDRFWASGLVFPLYDERNQHIGFTKIFKDISSKEQTEINLKEERALAQTIVQSHNECIVVLNSNLDVVNGTSTFLRLFSLDQVSTIGKQFFEIIDGCLNVAQLRSLVDTTLKSHTFYGSFDVEYNCPDSGAKSLRVKPRRIYQPPSLLFSLEFEDWTKDKAVNEEKDVFISVASHELKTPLSVIKAYGQILEKESKDAKLIVKKAVSKVNEQITYMNTLVTALLDTTRITAGKFILNPEAINLCSLVNEMAAAFRLTQTTHNIVIEQEDDVIIWADEVQTGGVITNLLSNAVKYSPNAQKVIVNIQAEENIVKVSVQDFGLGIPNNEQSQIFQRFGRTESIKKTNIPGNGLGLHLSKEIINLQGGQIGFISEYGKGSTFYFSLPLY